MASRAAFPASTKPSSATISTGAAAGVSASVSSYSSAGSSIVHLRPFVSTNVSLPAQHPVPGPRAHHWVRNDRASRASRLWVIWLVGLAAYMVGVMQRTSFGIAGLDAAARFHATPAALSGFLVLQLLVYAAFRCPRACCWTASGRASWSS